MFSPQGLVKFALRLAAAVAPSLAANFTWRVFCTPLVASRPTHSQGEMLSQALPFQVEFGRHKLRCYRWGATDRPTLLAVHGWGGRAHVFGDLIEPLLKAGFSIVSFDAPGHAKRGQRTNMLEYSSAIRTVCREIGQVQGLLGHSFGAFTSAYTASKLSDLKAVALIGAPDRLEFILNYAGEMLDAPQHIMRKLEGRIEKLSGEPLEAHCTVKYLKSLTLKTLVVHDAEDRDVPVERARRLAQELEAAYHETQGLGHHRILHSQDVGDRLARFFAAAVRVC